jgi:RNA polymerase sigma factor (sigma-70 family)
MNELEIVKGCIENNNIAQQELYTRYGAKMLAVCYRYAKNRDDAEDMLQEAFIKIFTQIKQFRGDGSIEGWIRKIIIHTCINNIKKNKKFNDSVDLMYAKSLQSKNDDVPSIMQAKQIIDCIRLLPLGYRTVLNLFAIEGLSHKEIGQMLDIEESTSRSQYTRAKVMLQNLLIKKNILPAKQNATQQNIETKTIITNSSK